MLHSKDRSPTVLGVDGAAGLMTGPIEKDNAMKNYPDVFISYARADGEDFAHRLYDDLEADHINVWLDTYDIPPGADWDAKIDR
jgi:hypothetical protein